MLTDMQVRKAAPQPKPYKLFDGGGLFLLVKPSGSKLWRLKYRHGGKEKLLAIGSVQDVSLKEARARREAARKSLDLGLDPMEAKREELDARAAEERARDCLDGDIAGAESFERIAREWHTNIHSAKVSVGHAARTLVRLEQDVFPWVGKKPIKRVTAPVLLEVLRRVERRGAIETTHRIKDSCGQVFRYGIACGHCERDPSRDLRDALVPVNAKHMAAMTDPLEVGRLLRQIDAYTGLPLTRAALALAPLVFQRPGNLRMMEWSEVDLEAGRWIIPARKMKRSVEDKLVGNDHVVPLSRQAVSILRDIKPLSETSKFVFPGVRGSSRPMSDMTLNGALQRLGFDTRSDMTTHGFRAMARTMLAERLGFPDAIIEAQLAHSVKDALGRAYNRTTFEDQRTGMMQRWADYLDALRGGKTEQT